MTSIQYSAINIQFSKLPIACCLLFFACCLLPVAHSLKAQEYSVKASLQPVPVSRFYKIPVVPELTAHAKADLSDIRIMDAGNAQIPFILKHFTPGLPGSRLTDFPILDNQLTDSNQTVLELDSRAVQGMDRLSLVMANTAVARFTTLSGSNDRKRWFIIDDHILLSPSGNAQAGNFVQSVYFPFSRYSYLKLVIHNGRTDPLNILKAGVYKDTAYDPLPRYAANPAPSFSQKDSSDGFSYITIRQKAPYLIDRVVLAIKGARFYKRTATLFEARNNRQGRKENYYLTTAELSSAREPAVALNGAKATSLLLKIENGDNPPLKVEAVHTEQLPRYLVAWLEKGNSYTLLAGNPEATAPLYDLAQFTDSIPAALTALTYGRFESATRHRDQFNVFATRYWLWPAIVLMLLALSFLTYRLMKDMKHSGV